MNTVRRRALILGGGMAAAAVLGLFAVPRHLASGPALDLERLVPREFDGWRIDPLAAALVRPGNELAGKIYQQVLERTYVDDAGRRVMLSMAYGREQGSNLELHWPEVCYRFGGFVVRDRESIELDADGRRLPVTRLVAELPGRPEPVTYWAVLAGERVGDANAFRLRHLAHSVRRQVADGLLVRVSSVDPLTARAFAIQAEFIADLIAALPAEDRAHIEGAASAA